MREEDLKEYTVLDPAEEMPPEGGIIRDREPAIKNIDQRRITWVEEADYLWELNRLGVNLFDQLTGVLTSNNSGDVSIMIAEILEAVLSTALVGGVSEEAALAAYRDRRNKLGGFKNGFYLIQEEQNVRAN